MSIPIVYSTFVYEPVNIVYNDIIFTFCVFKTQEMVRTSEPLYTMTTSINFSPAIPSYPFSVIGVTDQKREGGKRLVIEMLSI